VLQLLREKYFDFGKLKLGAIVAQISNLALCIGFTVNSKIESVGYGQITKVKIQK
jgi:hypothetical protein